MIHYGQECPQGYFWNGVECRAYKVVRPPPPPPPPEGEFYLEEPEGELYLEEPETWWGGLSEPTKLAIGIGGAGLSGFLVVRLFQAFR